MLSENDFARELAAFHAITSSAVRRVGARVISTSAREVVELPEG